MANRYQILTTSIRRSLERLGIDPAAARELSKFFEEIAEKVTDSDTTISDIEQRAGNPEIARGQETQKIIADIVKSAVIPLRAKVYELEKQVSEMNAVIRRVRSLYDIENAISEIEKSYRPKG